MDRAKLVVYLFGLYGLVTIGEAIRLALMAGFEPQLSVLFAGGFLISGVTVRTIYQGCYDEFALFRQRALAFWAVAVSVTGYVAGVLLQFL